MPQNLIEKIAQKAANPKTSTEKIPEVRSGNYLSISPSYVMTHDNSAAVIAKFNTIGAKRVAFPRQIVCTLDHNVQDQSEKNLAKYAKIEKFCEQHQLDFYPAGRGIGHQIMCEEGYAWPGEMVVASDSHSNMYGGLGCLGTPVVRTDAAAIWATGKTWWQVPPVALVEFQGKLSPGVTGKDVIVALCGSFNHDEVLNHAVEFVGEGVASLSVDQRLTIANMTTEWGALAGVFAIDEMTIAWLAKRAKFIAKRGPAGVPSDQESEEHPRLNATRISQLQSELPFLQADAEAEYSRRLTLDLSTVRPCVCGPNSVKTLHTVSQIHDKKIKIDKAYLVSCVNSRVEDLAEAARVVAGNKVASGVEFYISAASSEVQAESEKRGDWQALVQAGAIPLPSGCGPCIGLGKGLLQDGEVGISATNRNFRGRMGSRNAEAYLASPTVVATSAINGYITGEDVSNEKILTKIEISEPKNRQEQVEILPGFPPSESGQLVFCQQNNINTDGIYPGKYTYREEITPAQQAEVVMENYDPEFRHIAQPGDILIGGYNFGMGSSREQAATALKYFGIKLVIAGSFSETYKRNALNNGFITVESPGLVDFLKKNFADDQRPTIATKIFAHLDFATATIQVQEQSYSMSPMGQAAQELIMAGGLENWVKKQIS